MKTVASPDALRCLLDDLRTPDRPIGLVPTMGALHKGHAALMRQCKADGCLTVASIFVNPAQFAPHEDLSRYPRTPEEDARLLESEGVDILYSPDADAMYPAGCATTIHVSGLTDYLCGPFRPGHFDGVATIVAKLFNQTSPDRAYFGEKDWQQLQLVKKLVRDLDMPVCITGVPTVREEDGLALSSRNRYLSEAEREKAAAIPRMLRELAAAIRAGQPVSPLLDGASAALAGQGFVLDYLELADAESCAPVSSLDRPARLFIAARLGATRLIDNWPV